MPSRPILIPGPDHPIAIERHDGRVVVRLAGKIVADSVDALTLRETNLPPVHYIPRKDVEAAMLVKSETSTYCPYKGDASYFSIAAGGERSRDAIWSYEEPFDAVIAIKGHMAFYPDRVDEIGDQS